MSKILVIAEKPSVGKSIGNIFNCNNKGNGYIEGKTHIITWALGHLVTLGDPEVYDKKYATWNLEVLPIIFDKPKFVPLDSTKKQYNIVKNLLRRKDVSSVVIATDAGREGELVARLILNHTGNKKPVKRLWISSVTDKAIKEGFKNLKPGKNYDSLYQSALARAEADWIVGINATRALTTKYNAQLSCGRVQTPTLQMICSQDDKVKSFKSQEYYNLTISTDITKFKLIGSDNKVQTFFEQEKLEKYINILKDKTIKIVDIKSQNKIQKPKKLYDLTTLQREANEMYGYSAKATLDIIQGLYEYHKVVTYPRTDSSYLTKDMIDTLGERIEASDVFNFDIKNINVKEINTKGFVNDKLVSDHHAIIPTEERCNLQKLSSEEERIYKLIVQRFLSNLLPDYKYIQKTIKAKYENNFFQASGQEIVSKGWKTIYEKVINLEEDEFEEEQQEIKKISVGNTFEIKETEIQKNHTKSPKFFTESSLLGAMENPSRYVVDKQEQKILVDTGGIGTVATRADIIEKLQNSFVVEKQGNFLHITNKGRQLLEVAPTELKSPKLTAKWEKDLKLIEIKKLTHDKYMDEIKKYTIKIIYDIKNNFYEFTHDNLTQQKCEKCSSLMLYATSKNGKVLTCSSIDCKHKVYIYIPKRNKCPNCMKRLEILGTGFEKEAMYCKGCGYRKNMLTLLKEQKTQGASKKDVKKLLKKQSEEVHAPKSPFAKFFEQSKGN